MAERRLKNQANAYYDRMEDCGVIDREGSSGYGAHVSRARGANAETGPDGGGLGSKRDALSTADDRRRRAQDGTVTRLPPQPEGAESAQLCYRAPFRRGTGKLEVGSPEVPQARGDPAHVARAGILQASICNGGIPHLGL